MTGEGPSVLRLAMDPDAMTSLAMQDIARERAATSFNISAVAEYLDGGSEAHKARLRAQEIIRNDPAIAFKSNGEPFEMTHAQWREKTLKQVLRLNSIFRELERSSSNSDMLLIEALKRTSCELSESLGMKLYVHDVLYKDSIKVFGTPEQVKKFLPDPMDSRIFGCFAMTELGHSSALQDLETTATFDPATKDWIIHSPTLSSTKWWIGNAGQTATHAVMVCQTIVIGRQHGLSWFVVPLRDPATLRLLPGVSCGDVGPKAGRLGLDNGWIQLTNVRVPLDNMLMRWMQVSGDGTVSPPAHPALMYATLIPERIIAVGALRLTVAQSVTIACRYGVTRRQGAGNPQIIDFQIQTVNMMPLVAGIYVYASAYGSLTARWEALTLRSVSDPGSYFLELPDIHCISAGIKAVSTWWGSKALETCRRACGGHAYSAYNAIAGHIADWGVLTTGGGDNFVLIQQLARYVLSRTRAALNDHAEPSDVCVGSASFLNRSKRILSSAFKMPSIDGTGSLSDFETIIELFSFLVVKMAADLDESISEGKKMDEHADVWNKHIADSTKLGHTLALHLEALNSSAVKESSELSSILTKCGVLYAADILRQEGMDTALELGCFTKANAVQVREVVTSLAKILRHDVVGLTDAFGFPDFILKAPIGRYDGDIYRQYFTTVVGASDCFNTDFFQAEVRPLLSSRL
ncbi:Peroxisomal acyl-coenzyme A oxidase 1 [Entophlyctis luteolus]|nr:Peroxisomal acyl-coenzyme A oxidase 1 [Entophlyctis luteolus]